jgi:hypothetical protein
MMSSNCFENKNFDKLTIVYVDLFVWCFDKIYASSTIK